MLDKLEGPDTAVPQNHSCRFVRLRSAHTPKVITSRLLSTLAALAPRAEVGVAALALVPGYGQPRS